jgi:pyruvate,water dikinase
MKISKVFKEIGRDDAAIAGGKGASLGEMTQAKLPVPPGFVILAESFDYFVEKAGLEKKIEAELKKVRPTKQTTVDKASETIRQLILEAKMPEEIKKEAEAQFNKLGATLVAVRSSATAEDSSAASWAGELETYLNVTNKNLMESIKLCWSSLFTPRAIFYRFEKKLDKHAVSVAVVVQKMVQSDVSGIAFTVHPVTKNYDQMIIEAGYGLGEAIVGGMITPDMYVVEKKDMSIAEINISEQEMMIVRSAKGTAEVKVKPAIGGKQKLAGKKIIELAKICEQIEKHYGFPCDIEWAMEKNKFYITQSRPITTL